MSEVVALVAGETESTFVRDVLCGHLASRDVWVWARLPGHAVRRGGIRKWESIRGDILRTLKERAERVCTTMFDFYAMPRTWPGRAEAAELSAVKKGPCVERAMLTDLIRFAGNPFRPEQFIPYVQVHEFEALLFTDVTILACELTSTCVAPADLRDRLAEILAVAGQPEAINDSWDTCPSRRIAGLVRGYHKRLDGPKVAQKIGLAAIRERCPHFGQWLDRLEALGTVQ